MSNNNLSNVVLEIHLRAMYFYRADYCDTNNGVIAQAIQDRYGTDNVSEAVATTHVNGIPYRHERYTPEMFAQDQYSAKNLDYSLSVVRTLHLYPPSTV